MLERMVQARPNEARLGGDPSVANKVRVFPIRMESGRIGLRQVDFIVLGL